MTSKLDRRYSALVEVCDASLYLIIVMRGEQKISSIVEAAHTKGGKIA